MVDLSQTALDNIKIRVPSFPHANLIKNDFFDLDLSFDLIIEQTFFCAIHPDLRADYAKKAFNMLHNNGKIVGLLFGIALNTTHPPFGGTKTEYLNHFDPYFNIAIMDNAINSASSRAHKELFIKIEKRKQ